MLKVKKKTIIMILWLVLSAPFISVLFAADVGRIVRVLRFQTSELSDWQMKGFQGETRYNLVELDGRYAIKAVSNKTASAYYRELEVDIQETPYLTWSWKVVDAPGNENEKVKAGDDFSARVYVVIKDGFFPWQTKALNYVWAMNEKVGSSWSNPYTGNVMMKAVASGREGMGEWQSYKINVYEDLKTLFGKDFHMIHGVAIMTDTDNTGKSATTYYGEITFVER